jgi:tRNA G18 (ribose-2'-O)-methylase SpoU
MASRLSGIRWNVHTILQDRGKEELREIAERIAIPVHLMLLNLDGNMNIAMSIRSAAVLGCSDVWIVGRRSYDARPEVGAKNYIRVHKIDSLGENPSEFLESLGVQPYLIEQGGQALEDMKFPMREGKPPCFIMGSESHGIDEKILKSLADVPRITISQYGLVRSLNVSIAASIVMYEYLRQWRGRRKEI